MSKHYLKVRLLFVGSAANKIFCVVNMHSEGESKCLGVMSWQRRCSGGACLCSLEVGCPESAAK